MSNSLTARFARFWRPGPLTQPAIWLWRTEWIVGLALVVVGTLLFFAGLYQVRTAPREHSDAGMFGVIIGPLTALLGGGLILAAVSLRAPGSWRWAGQIAAAVALLYLSAQCAS